MKTKHLVVDTAAFLNILPLWEYGEEFYSVPEVVAEIRGKVARERYAALPITITMRQPQPWAIKFISDFSKKTGDYASLSLADLKVLALTYEIEIEARGSADHLRLEPQKPAIDCSPPKQNIDDQPNPGFHLPSEQSDGLMTSSSILLSESFTEDVETNRNCYSLNDSCNEDLNINHHLKQYVTLDSSSCPALKNSTKDLKQATNIYWCHMRGLEDYLGWYSYIGGYNPTSDDSDVYKALTKEYPQFRPSSKDTSMSDYSAHNMPLSTTLRPLHSTFPRIRRWSFHIASFSEEERSQFPSSGREIEEILLEFGERIQNREASSPVPDLIGRNTALLDTALQVDLKSLSLTECPNETEEVKEVENKREITVNNASTEEEDVDDSANYTEESDGDESSSCVEDDYQSEGINEELKVDYEDQQDLKAKDSSEDEDYEDDEDAEDADDEGWITPSNIKRYKLKTVNEPASEDVDEQDVFVACITADFAVQNILKHIGLSVMGVDGKLIRQIRTFIFRCYACFKTTSNMSKIFCPNCGNKTLKKVSVTVNPDGTQKIWINFKRRINTKGMKFSLPRPRGGQHARNPILVADQKEVRQISSKMSKKKINPLHEDYDPESNPFAIRDVYSRASQLGYMGGKCHNHYYWESKNPNAREKKYKKKKK